VKDYRIYSGLGCCMFWQVFTPMLKQYSLAHVGQHVVALCVGRCWSLVHHQQTLKPQQTQLYLGLQLWCTIPHCPGITGQYWPQGQHQIEHGPHNAGVYGNPGGSVYRLRRVTQTAATLNIGWTTQLCSHRLRSVLNTCRYSSSCV